MDVMSLGWGILALILAFLGLLGTAGVVLLVLKVIAVVQKAAEPPTVDSGHYGLKQSKDVGQRE
ncbi:MAG: hypothetical protein ISS56_16390 [Anaerolineae bacterium]|jgi:hypothetical protein|nr:hypothetical protein [Anaerolineae bacterium]